MKAVRVDDAGVVTVKPGAFGVIVMIFSVSKSVANKVELTEVDVALIPPPCVNVPPVNAPDVVKELENVAAPVRVNVPPTVRLEVVTIGLAL